MIPTITRLGTYNMTGLDGFYMAEPNVCVVQTLI